MSSAYPPEDFVRQQPILLSKLHLTPILSPNQQQRPTEGKDTEMGKDRKRQRLSVQKHCLVTHCCHGNRAA